MLRPHVFVNGAKGDRMPRRNNHVTEDLTDLAKDAGKGIVRGFGRILGVGTVAALFGGAGGGILSVVYSFPIVAGIVGGAILAVVAVLAFVLLAANTW
jgi:hypothetical protein